MVRVLCKYICPQAEFAKIAGQVYKLISDTLKTPHNVRELVHSLLRAYELVLPHYSYKRDGLEDSLDMEVEAFGHDGKTEQNLADLNQLMPCE